MSNNSANGTEVEDYSEQCAEENVWLSPLSHFKPSSLSTGKSQRPHFATDVQSAFDNVKKKMSTVRRREEKPASSTSTTRKIASTKNTDHNARRSRSSSSSSRVIVDKPRLYSVITPNETELDKYLSSQCPWSLDGIYGDDGKSHTEVNDVFLNVKISLNRLAFLWYDGCDNDCNNLTWIDHIEKILWQMCRLGEGNDMNYKLPAISMVLFDDDVFCDFEFKVRLISDGDVENGISMITPEIFCFNFANIFIPTDYYLKSYDNPYVVDISISIDQINEINQQYSYQNHLSKWMDITNSLPKRNNDNVSHSFMLLHCNDTRSWKRPIYINQFSTKNDLANSNNDNISNRISFLGLVSSLSDISVTRPLHMFTNNNDIGHENDYNSILSNDMNRSSILLERMNISSLENDDLIETITKRYIFSSLKNTFSSMYASFMGCSLSSVKLSPDYITFILEMSICVSKCHVYSCKRSMSWSSCYERRVGNVSYASKRREEVMRNLTMETVVNTESGIVIPQSSFDFASSPYGSSNNTESNQKIFRNKNMYLYFNEKDMIDWINSSSFLIGVQNGNHKEKFDISFFIEFDLRLLMSDVMMQSLILSSNVLVNNALPNNFHDYIIPSNLCVKEELSKSTHYIGSESFIQSASLSYLKHQEHERSGNNDRLRSAKKSKDFEEKPTNPFLISHPQPITKSKKRVMLKRFHFSFCMDQFAVSKMIKTGTTSFNNPASLISKLSSSMKNEMRILSTIPNHDNIVKYHGWSFDGSCVSIAMEPMDMDMCYFFAISEYYLRSLEKKSFLFSSFDNISKILTLSRSNSAFKRSNENTSVVDTFSNMLIKSVKYRRSKRNDDKHGLINLIEEENINCDYSIVSESDVEFFVSNIIMFVHSNKMRIDLITFKSMKDRIMNMHFKLSHYIYSVFISLRNESINNIAITMMTVTMKLFSQAFSALNHIHSNAIVHRDLKSQNMMLKFGMIEEKGKQSTTKTQSSSSKQHHSYYSDNENEYDYGHGVIYNTCTLKLIDFQHATQMSSDLLVPVKGNALHQPAKFSKDTTLVQSQTTNQTCMLYNYNDGSCDNYAMMIMFSHYLSLYDIIFSSSCDDDNEEDEEIHSDTVNDHHINSAVIKSAIDALSSYMNFLETHVLISHPSSDSKWLSRNCDVCPYSLINVIRATFSSFFSDIDLEKREEFISYCKNAQTYHNENEHKSYETSMTRHIMSVFQTLFKDCDGTADSLIMILNNKFKSKVRDVKSRAKIDALVIKKVVDDILAVMDNGSI